MTAYKHQRPLLSADVNTLRTVAAAMPATTQVDLGIGDHHYQGLLPQCSAAAIANVVESCNERHGDLFPPFDPQYLYYETRRRFSRPLNATGEYLEAVADTYCSVAGTGITWTAIPLDPELWAEHLLVEQTAIAFGMRWNESDEAAANNRVLLAPAGGGGIPHAVSVHGWQRGRPYKTRWWRSKSPKPVFAIENSNNIKQPEWFIPAQDIVRRGMTALVFHK